MTLYQSPPYQLQSPFTIQPLVQTTAKSNGFSTVTPHSQAKANHTKKPLSVTSILAQRATPGPTPAPTSGPPPGLGPPAHKRAKNSPAPLNLATSKPIPVPIDNNSTRSSPSSSPPTSSRSSTYSSSQPTTPSRHSKASSTATTPPHNSPTRSPPRRGDSFRHYIDLQGHVPTPLLQLWSSQSFQPPPYTKALAQVILPGGKPITSDTEITTKQRTALLQSVVFSQFTWTRGCITELVDAVFTLIFYEDASSTPETTSSKHHGLAARACPPERFKDSPKHASQRSMPGAAESQSEERAGKIISELVSLFATHPAAGTIVQVPLVGPIKRPQGLFPIVDASGLAVPRTPPRANSGPNDDDDEIEHLPALTSPNPSFSSSPSSSSSSSLSPPRSNPPSPSQPITLPRNPSFETRTLSHHLLYQFQTRLLHTIKQTWILGPHIIHPSTTNLTPSYLRYAFRTLALLASMSRHRLIHPHCITLVLRDLAQRCSSVEHIEAITLLSLGCGDAFWRCMRREAVQRAMGQLLLLKTAICKGRHGYQYSSTCCGECTSVLRQRWGMHQVENRLDDVVFVLKKWSES